MLVAPGTCEHAKGSMPAHGCPDWPEATGTSSGPGGWTPACAEKALRSSQPQAGQETTYTVDQCLLCGFRALFVQ